MTTKVVQLNISDIRGGAARAAYRIHHCLRRAGVDSRMWVNQMSSDDWTVDRPASKYERAMTFVRPQLAGLVHQPQMTNDRGILSSAIFPSRWRRRLNSSEADVVHLHWIGLEMLSISDIGRLRKPVVWTLHDMWAFCGAEHYTDDTRWREGYSASNRRSDESGFDLNRWVWKRKKKWWAPNIEVVTPSGWLGQCARESALMREWPVTVIPNPIDTGFWRPLEPVLARRVLDLPQDVPLVLFGAMGGGKFPRKGMDLLLKALKFLRGSISDCAVVVFGQSRQRVSIEIPFPMRFVGHLDDDFTLRALYSAADVMVIPSRQDNLPNTGLESLACGTPVVAFDTGGMPDIVDHFKTGYLARPFDAEDLARGIQWVLENRIHGRLRSGARAKAECTFSFSVVADAYQSLYSKILGAQAYSPG